MRRSSAMARPTRCSTVCAASTPTNTRTGALTCSRPVTARTSAAVVAVPTNRAPSRPNSATETTLRALPDTVSASGGVANPGSRPRPSSAMRARRTSRPYATAAAVPAATPAPIRIGATVVTGPGPLPAAARARDAPMPTLRPADAPTIPPRTTGNAARTRDGHGTRVAPLDRTATPAPTAIPAVSPTTDGFTR